MEFVHVVAGEEIGRGDIDGIEEKERQVIRWGLMGELESPAEEAGGGAEGLERERVGGGGEEP